MKDFPKGLKTETKREQLFVVQNDIGHYNRQIGKIDSQIKQLTNKKAGLAIKVSNKTKYKSILLKEIYYQNEDPLLVKCGDCGEECHIVRPGKWQCSKCE